MRFPKILFVCLALLCFVCPSKRNSAVSPSTANSHVRFIVLADGGPLPRPPLAFDGGAPLPPPPLAFDGGAPLPRPPLA